jgi:RNA polymerase sigma-70 factor, ECF subfamily
MEPSAFQTIILQYSELIAVSIENRVKKYGLSLSCEEIEDIRQDVVTSIWKDRKMEEVNNIESLPYWLSIVSGNAAMEYMRKRRRWQQPDEESLSDTKEGNELIDSIASDRFDPQDYLSRNELSEKIDRSIELLPPKEKLIIKLNLLHDKKFDEISEILRIPKGTVSSYVKRAKEKLRRALKDYK